MQKEPHLAEVLSKLLLRTASSAYDSLGIDLADVDTGSILKMLQKDNASYVYTIAMPNTITKSSFLNLVFIQTSNGVVGNTLAYEVEDKFFYKENGVLDFGKFTGSIKRYDLNGKLLRANAFVNGSQIGNQNARQEVTYCVDDYEYNYECVGGSVDDTASGGYGLNCDGVLYLDLFVRECDSEGGTSGSGDGFGTGSGTGSGDGDGNGGGGENGGGGSVGGGDPENGDPFSVVVISPPLVIAPSVWELNELIENKPFALYGKDIPCELVRQWIALANHKVSPELKQKINGLVGKIEIAQQNPYGIPVSYTYVADVLDIDNAYSSVVNMDYFSVNVKTMPVINGQRATPQQLLDKIRRDINSLVNPLLSQFTPYNYYGLNDQQLWNTSNPLGAVISISIPGDWGSVIVSQYSPSNWTFTTIKDPFNGLHPVSGNREFGYTTNADGSYTFYTRGVDRITSRLATFANYMTSAPILNNDGAAFELADFLWESFQKGIKGYVDDNQGAAVINPPVTHRPNWVEVKSVVDGRKPLNTLSNDCY